MRLLLTAIVPISETRETGSICIPVNAGHAVNAVNTVLGQKFKSKEGFRVKGVLFELPELTFLEVNHAFFFY